MSTRAVVRIIEQPTYRKAPIIYNLYHHFDGYPSGLGSFLINELKYLGQSKYFNDGRWGRFDSACDVVNFLIKHEEDKGFELMPYSVQTDAEYLYEVNVTMRTIVCKAVHCKNWQSKNPRYIVDEIIDLNQYKEKSIAELAI